MRNHGAISFFSYLFSSCTCKIKLFSKLRKVTFIRFYISFAPRDSFCLLGGGGWVVCKVNTIQSETQVIFLLLFFPLFISCSSGSILEIILGNFIHKGLIIKRRKRMFNLFVSYPVQVQCSLSTGNWLGNGLIPASPLSL